MVRSVWKGPLSKARCSRRQMRPCVRPFDVIKILEPAALDIFFFFFPQFGGLVSAYTRPEDTCRSRSTRKWGVNKFGDSRRPGLPRPLGRQESQEGLRNRLED